MVSLPVKIMQISSIIHALKIGYELLKDTKEATEDCITHNFELTCVQIMNKITKSMFIIDTITATIAIKITENFSMQYMAFIGLVPDNLNFNDFLLTLCQGKNLKTKFDYFLILFFKLLGD